MPFNNQTNNRRAEMIVETLGMVDKSARSNRADPEEIRTVLAPVFAKLSDMGLRDTATAANRPVSEPVTAAPAAASTRPLVNRDYGSLSDLRARLDNLTAKGLCDLIQMAAAELDKKVDP